jgi:SAM-dependent methyltransferase
MSAPARRDFSRAKVRSHVEAWILAHAPDGDEVRRHKQATIGAMRGTVVELGPGPGVNMSYYSPGVRVVAIEPNPVMHVPLRRAADEHDVDLEIRTLHAEDLGANPGGVGDGEADGVVGTLVLCGVDDPRLVLSQIRRVLAPGGTYTFFEHVRAPQGTWTRRAQRVVERPHAWVANGCRVDQDTAALLRDAGFGDLQVRDLDIGIGGGWTRTTIIGHATP